MNHIISNFLSFFLALMHLLLKTSLFPFHILEIIPKPSPLIFHNHQLLLLQLQLGLQHRNIITPGPTFAHIRIGTLPRLPGRILLL